jgi:hypothetical protein
MPALAAYGPFIILMCMITIAAQGQTAVSTFCEFRLVTAPLALKFFGHFDLLHQA